MQSVWIKFLLWTVDDTGGIDNRALGALAAEAAQIGNV